MAAGLSPADDSHGPDAAPGLRASDADRDRVAEILRVAAGDGRLTLDELDERLEAALSARARSELAALTADLHAVAGRTGSNDLVWITKSHGDIRRKGRWAIPRQMEIRITAGDVTLDFTEAEITHDSLDIDVQLDMRGALILVIKPGIVVDADDVTVSWGDIKVHDVTGPHVPAILNVKVTGRAPSGVVARLPRRSFPQWLCNKPRPYEPGPGRGLAVIERR
jgi:hypothetical protein